MSSVSRIIRRLDVYARVDDDLQVKTDTGAAVTIGFWALMAVLVIGEIQAYLMVQPATERVVVDNAIGQRLRINADITFHSIPCLDLHVDAMDVAGENQIDVDHDMMKQRLTADGSAIGEAFIEVLGEGDEGLELADDYCGSCYGAEQKAKGCCNTCREVTDAYTAMGWALHDIRRTAEQCIRDNHIETPIAQGEGCRLSGSMTVNKVKQLFYGPMYLPAQYSRTWTHVSGNFHMAAGEGVMRNGKHIHLFSMDDAESFNSSHTVHQLSFGDSFPGMQANPLDGMSRIIDEDVGTGLFQYFIKLVPTTRSIGAKEPHDGAFLTSQFAYTYKFRSLKGATEYHQGHDDDTPQHHATHGEEKPTGSTKAGNTPSAMLLPGVFFVYDVSPFMVEVLPAQETPLLHLVIRLCAVAGGAFAVSGMVDSAVYYASNRLKRHGLLG